MVGLDQSGRSLGDDHGEAAPMVDAVGVTGDPANPSGTSPALHTQRCTPFHCQPREQNASAPAKSRSTPFATSASANAILSNSRVHPGCKRDATLGALSADGLLATSCNISVALVWARQRTGEEVKR